MSLKFYKKKTFNNGLLVEAHCIYATIDMAHISLHLNLRLVTAGNRKHSCHSLPFKTLNP